jgi:hypothetical protein
VLDYRRWRQFVFQLVGAEGTEEKLTRTRHSQLSGGEQSVSLHLPLFAAAHAMLNSAHPHAPRLLALDEAFAGVDDTGRSELMGLGDAGRRPRRRALRPGALSHRAHRQRTATGVGRSAAPRRRGE